MKIHGREVKFFRSVMANCKVRQLAPGGDVDRFSKEILGSDDYEKSQRACAKLMAIMSEAAEQAEKYTNPEYKMRPLTEDEALSMSGDEFAEAFSEAMKAWVGEKPTVIAETKKTGKKTEQK